MATATSGPSPFSFSFEVGIEEKKKRPALYEALGCDQTSSAEQIQAEYRVRALRLHPDKAGEEGAEQFCKLQAAMSVLGDTRRRAQYDSWLASSLPLSFEEFSRNSAILSASTHWAPAPPSQGKITGSRRRRQLLGTAYCNRMNAYSLDGLVIVALLIICSCAYLKRIPRIRQILLSEKKGALGIFYKAAVIGVRLHWAVSAACLLAAVHTLFIR